MRTCKRLSLASETPGHKVSCSTVCVRQYPHGQAGPSLNGARFELVARLLEHITSALCPYDVNEDSAGPLHSPVGVAALRYPLRVGAAVQAIVALASSPGGKDHVVSG